MILKIRNRIDNKNIFEPILSSKNRRNDTYLKGKRLKSTSSLLHALDFKRSSYRYLNKSRVMFIIV